MELAPFLISSPGAAKATVKGLMFLALPRRFQRAAFNRMKQQLNGIE
jgi:hypothetical protein